MPVASAEPVLLDTLEDDFCLHDDSQVLPPRWAPLDATPSGGLALSIKVVEVGAPSRRNVLSLTDLLPVTSVTGHIYDDRNALSLFRAQLTKENETALAIRESLSLQRQRVLPFPRRVTHALPLADVGTAASARIPLETLKAEQLQQAPSSTTAACRMAAQQWVVFISDAVAPYALRVCVLAGRRAALREPPSAASGAGAS